MRQSPRGFYKELTWGLQPPLSLTALLQASSHSYILVTHHQHRIFQASPSLGDGLGGCSHFSWLLGQRHKGLGLVEYIPLPFLESLWHLPAVPGASGTLLALPGLVLPIHHTCMVTM